ncbi:MAG: glycosyltransferase [Dehalococcoidales bacterium]|nr:glycosyltransferase [Dehalococcoidales bacterium]
MKTVALLPSLHPGIAVPPAHRINSGGDLIIGLAGQIYATEEWQALLTALDTVGWKIRGRDVRIRLLGRWPRINASSPLRIEYLGWHTQEHTVKLLSEADLLYCPYWFDPVFETEARLSFASKLTTYFAAGRPVLFHGPDYAAPAAFLKENDAGFICNSNNQPRIIDALNTLAADEELCFRLASNARLAFDKHLTLDTLRSKFAEFLGVDENFLLPVT